MKRSTRLSSVFCVFIILSITATYAATVWPLKGSIDLSSGFGDFRNGRFHAGLDLRTGGVPGKPLYSPVDGYLYKIRMSYYGYGKGLYIKGQDGDIYVFGHLSGFIPSIERVIKAKQMAEKRYFVDIDFPADSAHVKKGQLLGYTGQTGVGAPHLHFEKRTSENIPLNPLTHGYRITDKVKPFFTRIGFQLTDDHSLFLNGQRKLFLDIPASPTGEYHLDTVLYFSSPFGVLADCFDRMSAGGMRQAVYKLSLLVDDKPYYQVTMDTIRFETGKAADLVYDFDQASDGEPRVRRLFHRTGNDYEGTHLYGSHLGLIGADSSLAAGQHRAKIVAEDAFGNRSELAFRFVWGPENPYVMDSSEVVNDSNMVFYFTGKPGVEHLGIDTVLVFLNRGSDWGIPPTISLTTLPNRHLRASVHGLFPELLTLRLVAVTADSCSIVCFPFSGFRRSEIKPAVVHHEVSEDGLIVWGDVVARVSYPVQCELYYRDSLLGVEKMSEFFSMKQYMFYIPPRPAYERIDKIAVRMTDDTSRPTYAEENLLIAEAGRQDSVRLSADAYFSVQVDSEDVYEPRFIEIKKSVIGDKASLHLNSEHYQVLPEGVLLKRPIAVTLEANPHYSSLDKTALYRLDKEANRWSWVTGARGAAGIYVGSSLKGGSFALVYDLDPPVISELNIAAGKVYNDLQPTIRFRLRDELSGIEDDRNFVIKLDGIWQIPEYDPEAGICQVTPLTPLAAGNHDLSIEVTDRVGNLAHQDLQFKVAPRPGKKRS